ncbi:hypothetical protein PVK06_025229 [Gossypium arboreum]|uniref:Uncharacterized protein n=1 Tax=Gossypium arboreum TaxID=29729 RepID=A0ABR0PG38_GOSAR|nr:hypothetical protein PVK06_025229 [Gossypium arboreum]
MHRGSVLLSLITVVTLLIAAPVPAIGYRPWFHLKPNSSAHQQHYRSHNLVRSVAEIPKEDHPRVLRLDFAVNAKQPSVASGGRQ